MKIFLSGITGSMGHCLLDSLEAETVVAGSAGRNGEVEGIKVYGYFDDVVEDFDVIIDFSNKFVTKDVLNFALKHKKPLVIATTDIDQEIVEKIEEASKEIPIVYSHNMSVGVNAIDIILGKLVNMLENYDVEIIEAHHNQKIDSPSGTAKMLFETIKENRQELYPVYDRVDSREKRQKNELGISVIRAGTIAGMHSVIFAGMDELVEIKHTATSKRIFAKGALKAAKFLLTKENGLYDMKDVLNVDN